MWKTWTVTGGIHLPLDAHIVSLGRRAGTTYTMMDKVSHPESSGSYTIHTDLVEPKGSIRNAAVATGGL